MSIYTRPTVEPAVTNQTRQALGFYGGNSARATLNQLPRRAPIQPTGSRAARHQSKPFEVVFREPTVSPYLNLYRDEGDDEGAPSYFAFVLPQMQQIEASRQQLREMQQLRGQLQGMPTTGGAAYSPGQIHSTGAARFMDTAQFYSGWRR